MGIPTRFNDGLSGDATVTATGALTIADGSVQADDVALAEGNVLVGNAAGAATALSAKTDGRILVGNGTTITSVAVSGDATLSNAGALTVADVTLGADAAGDIHYKSSATVTARLAKGSGARKLTMKSGGDLPTWDNGKIVKLDTTGFAAADNPVLGEFDYTVAPGTTGSLNICDCPDGTRLGYWVLGAGQTILGPVGAVGGINIACDQTDNEGLEVFSNWGPASGRPLSVGLDAAFYFLVKINIQTINGCDDLFVGFKRVELYNADMEAYDTYGGLGLNTAATPGAIKVRDELNGGGVANTDTTQTIASGTDLQIKILVTNAGVVTYQHDAAVPGTLAAPTQTHGLTFDDGDQVMPIVRFLHANAAQAGTVTIKNWEVGYQA